MEAHVITCGISSVLNMARASLVGKWGTSIKKELLEELANPRRASEALEKEEEGQINLLKRELVEFISANPREASAEMNAYFGYLQESDLEVREASKLIDEIHLIASDTKIGLLVADSLKDYLKSVHPEISVCVHCVEGFQTWEFERALKNLKRKVKLISEGKEVVLNLTGGFKAEVAALSALAAENGFRAYYIHEAGRRVVELPASHQLKIRLTRNEKLLGLISILLSIPYDSFLRDFLFLIPTIALLLAFLFVLWRV